MEQRPVGKQQIKSLADWEARTNRKAGHLRDQDRDRQADAGPSTLLSFCFPLDFDLERERVLLSLCEAASPTSAGQIAARSIALPKPSFCKAGDQDGYTAEVRKFLKAGLEAGNDPLAGARPSFKQAQRPREAGPEGGQRPIGSRETVLSAGGQRCARTIPGCFTDGGSFA